MDEILWQAIDERQGHFFDMTEKQAQAFFEAYLARREKRLNALVREYIIGGGGSSESDLDFSIDSLIPVWRWVRTQIAYRAHNKQELDRIMSIPFAAAREQQLSVRSLSQDSLALLSDIAFYFAEVLIQNLDGVHWKVCKSKLKRYVDKNQPVLGGFSPTPINPRSIVTGSAHRTLDGKLLDDALVQAFKHACDRIGKEDML